MQEIWERKEQISSFFVNKFWERKEMKGLEKKLDIFHSFYMNLLYYIYLYCKEILNFFYTLLYNIKFNN